VSAICPVCAAQLETPLSCAVCQKPLPAAAELTPFAILAEPEAFAVDVKALRKRFMAESRRIHPDFFGTATPELRALAEQNSARLNKAFAILSDDFDRADWLVEHLGGPNESAERAMPQAFLLEVLEWNETLEAARATHDASAVQRLSELQASLQTQRLAAMRAVERLLTPLPARGAASLSDVRRQLNAVRYIDRALNEIESLRLSKAAVR
jgi:molecular chaperone HscB